MKEWFRKEKLMLPNFEADKERDTLVEEYATLQRKSVAFALDRDGFSDEEVDRVRNQRQALEDELREYVRPYAELTEEPEEALERLRWDVAHAIHRTGRYQDHSWENWDHAELQYRKKRQKIGQARKPKNVE